MGISRFSAAVAACAAIGMLGACSDSASTGPSPNDLRPSLVVGPAPLTTSAIEAGKIKICKAASSPAGTYSFTFVLSGQPAAAADFVAAQPVTLQPGQCKTIYDREVQVNPNPTPGNPSPVTYATVTEAPLAGTVCAAVSRVSDEGTTNLLPAPTCPTARGGANFFHGTVITYTNRLLPPPPPVCDFITFGRLVVEVGGEKIVISGNAGGNAPGGGILGEMEIDVGDDKYHVQTIDDYFMPTSGPFANDPWARVILGASKSGASVELRLRDNPAPGGGEPGPLEGDMVYLNINDDVILGPATIDQGNIQLHPQCRGPK
jgi:hypothetical protein